MGRFFHTCGVLFVLSLPMSACELMLFPAPMAYTNYYTPYLRYEGALYAGCQASRLGPRGEQEISRCEESAAVGTGEKLFEITTDTWHAATHLPDRGARGVDAGVAVYAAGGAPTSERLVALWHGDMIIFDRHPLSSGKTGADLVQRREGLRVTELRNYHVTPYASHHKRALVAETQGEVLAALLFAAPIDFAADPHGPLYALELEGHEQPLIYYPEAQIVMMQKNVPMWDALYGMYVPLRMPGTWRAEFDQALAASPGTPDP